MARVCYVGPYDKWSKSKILRFRLLDNTGEISAVAFSKLADQWAKVLKFDSILEFQVEKETDSTYQVVKSYEGNLWINFNFKSLAKPMGEVRNIPSVIYSNLNNLTSTIPDSGERFNVVVELINCLPCCGPDDRYEVMQQEFRIRDYSKDEVDLTVKGNDLVKGLKAFQPNSGKVFVVIILQGRLNATFDDELHQTGNFIAVDQVEADVKILLYNSPLRKSFMKNRLTTTVAATESRLPTSVAATESLLPTTVAATESLLPTTVAATESRVPTTVAATESKRTYTEVANTGDDSGYENTHKKNKTEST